MIARFMFFYKPGVTVNPGASGADAEKQAWLAKYATGPCAEPSAPGVLSVEQVRAILRDQFGILPKRKAIGYSKPYPSDYDLIPLPPKYRLPEFTKFNGSKGASSIEHVSRYLTQLGMISVSDPLRVHFFSSLSQANVVELSDLGAEGQNLAFQINMAGPIRRRVEQKKEAVSGKRPQDEHESK